MIFEMSCSLVSSVVPGQECVKMNRGELISAIFSGAAQGASVRYTHLKP